MSFPNDVDGDALRRIAEHSDMSLPMDIDFMVDIPNEESGKQIAHLASQRGYVPAIEFDEESARWTCTCTKRILATYDGIMSAQRELDEISAPYGGRADGWGTFGNRTP